LTRKNSKASDSRIPGKHRKDGGPVRDEGAYSIDGMTGLDEFLRFRPSAIKEVTCKSSVRSKVEHLMRAAGAAELIRGVKTNDQSEHAVRFSVKLDYLDETVAFDRWKNRTHDLIVATDQVTDARNFGAIARSCAFFGVKEILIQNRRQVGITASSVGTAQGGFALTDVVSVTNLGRTIEDLKELGYWIIGADMNGEAPDKIAGFYEKSVLVLGSEDSGISRLVAEKCDRIVAIVGAEQSVESLNVSVAAGILLHSFAAKALQKMR